MCEEIRGHGWIVGEDGKYRNAKGEQFEFSGSKNKEGCRGPTNGGMHAPSVTPVAKTDPHADLAHLSRKIGELNNS